MKQRILMTVIRGDPGEHLLNSAQKMLEDGSVIDYILSLSDSDSLLFYNDHLDLWSMGDTFDRFLRPKTKLRIFSHDTSQLYAMRRDELTLRASPRNEEERLLRALLSSAKSIYRSPSALLFILRRIFDVSGGYSSKGSTDAEPDAALNHTGSGNSRFNPGLSRPAW